MPFIEKKEAFEILDEMKERTCKGSCRQVWLRNIGYALKTKTNPLHLTSMEHKRMTQKMREVKNKKTPSSKKTNKKYMKRNSPPYSANENCGKTMKGNDGKKYESIPDKNNICRWKLKK